MHHLLKSTTILTCLCVHCITFPPAIAQSTIDTTRIRQWIDSAWDLLPDYLEPARVLAYQAMAESQDQYYFGIVNSLQIIGEYYYGIGKLDSSVYYYQQALQHSQRQKDQKENANNYTSLASIYLDAGTRDSSLHYYQQAIRIFEDLRDSSDLCDIWLRYGSVYSAMGHHDQAMESFFKSVRICEAIHRDDYVGYNYSAMGVIHDKQGNHPKAEEYFHKGLAIFERTANAYGQMSVYNNLGIMYKNMKAYARALEAYTHSLLFADSLRFEQGQMSAHTNIGVLNVQLAFFENALHHNRLGLSLARKLHLRESVAENLNQIARAQIGLGSFDEALLNAEEALKIGQEVQSLEKQRDANLTLSEIFQVRNEYNRSLEYFKAYTIAKDSLFNSDRSKQIAELQTVYETEKKDKAILLLAKNAELDQAKKTRLWIALGLSLLAGSLLIYSQWLRRTRDRKILSQEKELEIKRRQTAELEREKVSRELDYKKQELAAKALQLARKNEFLQSLHEQVDHMRTHPENTVAESARRITRQIQMDIESEEEWEQFLASFREVHRDFIEHLRQAYPDISKSEIRLCCLMKMNLSAKELAALLNVTADGIKKARYRLRKKLNLDSEIDVQEYLLAFS